MNPGRIVMAYLAAPLITTSLFMLWGALGGSFHLLDFPFLLLVFCIPHLLGTLLWMPFVLSRDSRRFGRLFYLGAGAVSGFLTAAFASLLLGSSLQIYLGFTICGALSASIFREIAVTGEKTV
ncbi:MAG TPA: hypothetical protein VK747_06385 [Blastocatellia bacterium]|nr:hypothetical protein [Blastocatellia bacterium]